MLTLVSFSLALIAPSGALLEPLATREDPAFAVDVRGAEHIDLWFEGRTRAARTGRLDPEDALDALALAQREAHDAFGGEAFWAAIEGSLHDSLNARGLRVACATLPETHEIEGRDVPLRDPAMDLADVFISAAKNLLMMEAAPEFPRSKAWLPVARASYLGPGYWRGVFKDGVPSALSSELCAWLGLEFDETQQISVHLVSTTPTLEPIVRRARDGSEVCFVGLNHAVLEEDARQRAVATILRGALRALEARASSPSLIADLRARTKQQEERASLSAELEELAIHEALQRHAPGTWREPLTPAALRGLWSDYLAQHVPRAEFTERLLARMAKDR